MSNVQNTRREHDLLGQVEVPAQAYWGIHTLRAVQNFPLSGRRTDPVLIKAMGLVKKACCLANQELKFIDCDRAKAIIAACEELIAAKLDQHVLVDALAGGSGTSLNMNINEVLANRALEISGRSKGDYQFLSPLAHVNLHQSTNDVFPTAIKIACLFKLDGLEGSTAKLQTAFQEKEKEFAEIIKIGRTELQAAVPLTLGAEFSGFAEVLTQDRWRIFKAKERLRVINLGGTAVGTGLAAPRDYIFMAAEKLRQVSGLNLARAENLLYATQNADTFCEASGIVKTYAADLIKISGDLRLLNLLGEISLPRLQAGSSIMPGKTNPVILEAVIQARIKALAADDIVGQCVSRGSLQINEFLPLIADVFLESLGLLNNSSLMLAGHIRGITADQAVCREYLDNSPGLITAFLPLIGYEKAQELLGRWDKNRSLRSFLEENLGKETVEKTLAPHNLTSLGYNG